MVVIPGAYSGHADPMRADPNRARALAQSGLGEYAEMARRVSRMFRVDLPGARPMPHVIHVEDVTQGLPLDAVDAERVQKVVREARVSWGKSPYDRTVPQVHAEMVRLSGVLAKMPIDSHARVEIRRRAFAYWKRNDAFNVREPSMGFKISKSQAASPELLKAFPPKPGEKPRPGAPPQASGKPQGGPQASRPGVPPGKAQEKPGAPPPKGGKPQPGAQPGAGPGAAQQGAQGPKKPGKHTTPMQHSEADGGQTIDFGNGVVSHVPEDADYHFHARQYAIHTAGYETNKDHNPKVAESHRHAANMHGRVANALHHAGQTDRHPATVPQPVDPMAAGGAGGPMDPFADPMDRAGAIDGEGMIDEDGDGMHDPDEDPDGNGVHAHDEPGGGADGEGNPMPMKRPMLGKAPGQAGPQRPPPGAAGKTPAAPPARGAPTFNGPAQPPKKKPNPFGKSETPARSRFYFRRG